MGKKTRVTFRTRFVLFLKKSHIRTMCIIPGPLHSSHDSRGLAQNGDVTGHIVRSGIKNFTRLCNPTIPPPPHPSRPAINSP